MSDRGTTAPGPGWRMPGKLKSKNFRDATAPILNSMGDSVERANRMDFGAPGIHTQHGFFSAPQDQGSSGSAMRIVLLQDALLPGTYDLPGTAKGALMEISSGNRLAATSEIIDIVNYSTSIYGPIGGLVMCQTFSGLNVAIGSSG